MGCEGRDTVTIKTLELSVKSYFSGMFHAIFTHVYSPWHTKFLFNVVGLCAGIFITVSAQGAFQVLDNFDSLILGDIRGQNDWIATSGSGEIILDPAGDGNQFLKVNTDSGILHKTTKVAKGSTRMLFLRFRLEEHGEFSFGFSHLLNPFQYSDFGPELGMASATNSDPRNEFRVANSLTKGTYDIVKKLVPDSWYNIWILIDNTSATYQVWMNSIPGSDAQASDQLRNSEVESLFGFRTPTDKDLIKFFIKTGTNKSPVDGRFYLDDIHLENSDGINLNNPLVRLTQPRICLSWLFLLLNEDH